MKHDIKTYLILAAVFILSIGGCYLVPANDVIKAVVASPGIVSLLAALFQLIRDQAAFERAQEIQQKQFQFTLGAASHMANTAFDKHVEFCEKYMAELQSSVRTLWREGETPEALSHAGALFMLREEYAVWLTDEINENLGKFEKALRKLGAESHFVRTTTGSEQHAEQRSRTITSSFELFGEILGIDETQELNEDYAVEKIKIKVRDILGVEELTTLRKHLVQEASQVICSGT
ncbi:hypothetical protein [Shewanella sp. KCT]|uniref:hypothetical protein n=1 Tax=Shewanella sp. KCT TaxID=2569535 RepID=UPI001182C789|nr:hypothetical protein [Shewanella sp. KCT]TVP09298.1 hypothetical protein AYI87_20170 [Shewanella sp. KCT]